ncbi:MAG: DUF308 domain-containing protein [Candidatus Krumholzibacteria bacterium]|nr:DUF308 domain-containing protein [Candidatus Krumholzibacteria bacterium]
MSNDENAAPLDRIFGEIRENWGWLLGFGFLSVILGVIGLGMAAFITLASMVFYGIVLLIGGAAQFIHSFKASGWKAKLWHMLISLFYVIAGVVVVRNPVLASGLLTLFLAGAITAVGVARIIMAFQMKGTAGWGLILLGGIMALVLGIMIFTHWPSSSLVVIGLFISIELIANGWSAITVAIAARSASRA